MPLDANTDNGDLDDFIKASMETWIVAMRDRNLKRETYSALVFITNAAHLMPDGLNRLTYDDIASIGNKNRKIIVRDIGLLVKNGYLTVESNGDGTYKFTIIQKKLPPELLRPEG